MNKERFLKNIKDIVIEDIAKLGYRKEKLRLYYPLSSLNNLFETEDDEQKMLERINSLDDDVIGKLAASSKNGRFCITVSEEGVERICLGADKDEFIFSLVDLVSKHDVSMKDIEELFNRKGRLKKEKIENGEFDLLINFESGEDDYCYCFKDEGCHITYHRFTKSDYEDLFK